MRKYVERYKRTRGRKWLRLRHVVLVEEPVCQSCERRPSVEVDHIKPISKGGDDTRDNLQGLCLDCHEVKTRHDLGLKRKAHPVDVYGYPIVNN